MRAHRKIAATALAGTLLATAFGVAGASAQTTDAELTLTATGSLDITIPDSSTAARSLGSTAIPAAATAFTSAAGAFGDVRVVDGRASTLGWTAQATGTDFIHTGCPDDDAGTAGIQCSDANMFFDNAGITYTPGTPQVTLGGVAAPTAGFLGCSLGVDCAKVVYVATGSSDVTWSPTLSFTVTATHVAGTYAGSVTHSVA